MSVVREKYKSIFDTLKSEITCGKYAEQGTFPSEATLSRRFRVARETVRRAVVRLTEQGYLTRRSGSGTFVSKGAKTLRTIGLIVPGVAYSEFFPPIVSEINRRAREAGYTLRFGEVFSSDNAARVREVRELAAEFIRERVAGIIYQPIEGLSGSSGINGRILGVFSKAGIPVVLVDSDVVDYPNRSGNDLVGINDVEAGAQLARHLLSLGARRIDCLIAPNCAASDENRGYGVRSAVEAFPGGKCEILHFAPDDAKTLARHLRRHRPEAIVCNNDCAAAVLRQTLATLGFTVPGDILLAGFGDLQISRLMVPPLTTVRQPCFDIARTAFARLLERIADPTILPVEIFLPATMVVRASTSGFSKTKPKKYTKKGEKQ